jgi:type IV secretory pathway TrbD component
MAFRFSHEDTEAPVTLQTGRNRENVVGRGARASLIRAGTLAGTIHFVSRSAALWQRSLHGFCLYGARRGPLSCLVFR